MKILKTFDFDCLIAHVRMTHDVSRDAVKYYTLALERAGYLKNTGSARKKSFVLLKNTGSKAPYVMAVKEVYDPNLDEIVLRDDGVLKTAEAATLGEAVLMWEEM